MIKCILNFEFELTRATWYVPRVKSDLLTFNKEHLRSPLVLLDVCDAQSSHFMCVVGFFLCFPYFFSLFAVCYDVDSLFSIYEFDYPFILSSCALFFKDWSQTNKDNWHFILCYVDDNNYYLRVKHEIIATDLKDNCVDNRSRICQKCSDFAFLIRTLVNRHWSDSCRRNTLLVH